MILELNKAFSWLKYSDRTHQYFSKDGVELQSVTRAISKLKEPFNSNYWTVYKAYQYSGAKVGLSWYKDDNDKWQKSTKSFKADGVTVYLDDDHSYLEITPEMVAKQWKIESLVGTTRGSYTHNLLEVLERGFLDRPEVKLPPGLNELQDIEYMESIRVVNRLCNQFLEDYNYLIPIAIEYKVGDLLTGLAGTFDRLYFNTRSTDYEIWDFKTDKKIAKDNKYQRLKIFDLPDCEVSKYDLQTSFYKNIIQCCTGIILGQSNILHINLKNESLDLYPCKDYCNEINQVDWNI